MKIRPLERECWRCGTPLCVPCTVSLQKLMEATIPVSVHTEERCVAAYLPRLVKALREAQGKDR